jgi:hypothetical protein
MYVADIKLRIMYVADIQLRMYVADITCMRQL